MAKVFADGFFDHARAAADAVLYEGYVLYPYRRSSGKNRVRWQFGVLAPPRWIEANGVHPPTASGAVESWYQHAEILVQAPRSATVHVRLRFLQLQDKRVEALRGPGEFEAVPLLQVGPERHLPFEEAVPRELDVVARLVEVLDGVVQDVIVPAGTEVEPIVDEAGGQAGRVVRARWPITAVVRLTADVVDASRRLLRLRVRTENADTTPALAGVARDTVLRHSLIAAHSLVAISEGSPVSLLDPPAWAESAARACRNEYAFPVLAGEPGGAEGVLASPIILYDHPRVAPESPGDLFDATEIDEILSLRTMTLTDEEKREARATDPRVAALVDRVDAMPDEAMGRLHGAVRSLRPLQPSGDG
jgi:hypothetical protein